MRILFVGGLEFTGYNNKRMMETIFNQLQYEWEGNNFTLILGPRRGVDEMAIGIANKRKINVEHYAHRPAWTEESKPDRLYLFPYKPSHGNKFIPRYLNLAMEAGVSIFEVRRPKDEHPSV